MKNQAGKPIDLLRPLLVNSQKFVWHIRSFKGSKIVFLPLSIFSSKKYPGKIPGTIQISIPNIAGSTFPFDRYT